MARLDWNGDELEKRFAAASERGLDAAATVAVNGVQRNISRPGMPTSRSGRRALKAARKLINLNSAGDIDSVTIPRTRRQRDGIIPAQEEAMRGLVDPPGGFPRLRTGQMRRSMTHDGVTGEAIEGKRRVGPDTSADYYAIVHELGSSRVPARPFLTRSVFQTRDGQIVAYEAAMETVFT